MQVGCIKLDGERKSGRGGVILQICKARVIGLGLYWRRLVVQHDAVAEWLAHEMGG
jgi:hypothetical protein